MNRELTIKLIGDFPLLYGGFFGDIKDTLMPFGFECGDGWFDLIYNLSKKLDLLFAKYTYDKPEVLQIKEKFGELRYYISHGDDEIFRLIEEAEKKSYTICERCGKPGSLRERNNWLSTLCDSCFYQG